MTTREQLNLIALKQDEYGLPDIHRGGLYYTLDDTLVMCIEEVHGKGTSEIEIINDGDTVESRQAEKVMRAIFDQMDSKNTGAITEYGFVVIRTRDQKDVPLGVGFYSDPDGLVVKMFNFSIMYQVKYVIKGLFKKQKGAK